MKRSPSYPNFFNRFSYIPTLKEVAAEEELKRKIDKLREQMRSIEDSLIDNESKQKSLSFLQDKIDFNTGLIEANILLAEKHGLLNRQNKRM